MSLLFMGANQLPTKSTDWGRFTAFDAIDHYRLIVRSYGWDKVGKSHFGLSMPGPILGLYMDPAGNEGVVQKFLKPPLGPKEIRGIQYRFNKKFDDQDTAKELRDQWIADYEHGLTVARSIQWDETETWELFRFAEFGRESSKGQNYGPINGMYRGLIQKAFDKGVNVQLIQKVKNEWVDDKPTNGMKPLGFPQAGNIVQVSLEHHWSREAGFQVKIVNCRQNTDIWGETFDNLDFPSLGQLVYPTSQESDWL